MSVRRRVIMRKISLFILTLLFTVCIFSSCSSDAAENLAASSTDSIDESRIDGLTQSLTKTGILENETATELTTDSFLTSDTTIAAESDGKESEMSGTEGGGADGESDDGDSSEEVWVSTGGGTKYHRSATCSKMKNPRCISRSEAESEGFAPCKKCY